GEKIVKDIKRATRKHYSSEEKIRIVLDGLKRATARQHQNLAQLATWINPSVGPVAANCIKVSGPELAERFTTLGFWTS
ncbi:MAG: hypothetical protein QNL92_01070, partial [Octadecabacter sp.]